jgi:hypothetical protein
MTTPVPAPPRLAVEPSPRIATIVDDPDEDSEQVPHEPAGRL